LLMVGGGYPSKFPSARSQYWWPRRNLPRNMCPG
jgi:hypothetical protein